MSTVTSEATTAASFASLTVTVTYQGVPVPLAYVLSVTYVESRLRAPSLVSPSPPMADVTAPGTATVYPEMRLEQSEGVNVYVTASVISPAESPSVYTNFVGVALG
jgi:hypothetical protein